MDKNKIYQTQSFDLAIVLSALGYKLVFIDKTRPQFIFEFENSDEIPSIVSAYYAGELKMDPRIVLLHSKLVKNRMYGG